MSRNAFNGYIWFWMCLCSFAGPAGATPAALLPAWEDISIPTLISDGLARVSPQLLIAFMLGIAAGEIGRVAWKTGLGVWKKTVDVGSDAARYGAIAGVLACVLYFM